MILVDSKIPMYLVGTSHPHKMDAERLIEDLLRRQERLVTDAEVLQEILHRYAAIDRRAAIQPAFDALLGIVDEVLPIDIAIVERAKQVVLQYQHLSARDAIHVSIMEQNGITQILSFDSGFDAVPRITRLS